MVREWAHYSYVAAADRPQAPRGFKSVVRLEAAPDLGIARTDINRVARNHAAGL